MTDNKDKKPSPTTVALLDAVFETTGIYRRDSAADVYYDYAWPTDILGKTKHALTHSAQAPLLKLLGVLLVPDPAPEKKDAVGVAPKPPVMFRVHRDIPFGFHFQELPEAFDPQIAALPVVAGKPQEKVHPLRLDAVLMLPAKASLDPKRHALPPTDEKYAPPPTLLARARVARLVDGTKIAALAQPIEAALELNLAHKPDPLKPPFFAGVALTADVPHGTADKPKLRLALRDAAYLAAKDDAARAAATREVAWAFGDSPVLPIVRTALLVLRRWVVWLTEKNPLKTGEKPHVSHRLKDHLFPLVEGMQLGPASPPGSPPPRLPAFPLDALRPDLGKLKDWLKGFTNPLAALSVLPHLRALLTGSDSDKTAPGSAIAWLTDRTGADDHSKPKDQDFGLVIRTRGDAGRGDAALGLRGQKSWKVANDAVRIGLALEGELVGASWDIDASVSLTGPPKASARAKARTGAAHLFLVVEPTDPNGALLAANVPGLADLGALVRLEFGATLSAAGLLPEVRVTLRKGDAAAVARSLVREILDLKEAIEARIKAEADALVAGLAAEVLQARQAAEAELRALITTLKAELTAAVDAVAAATAAFFADGTLGALLDPDVKAALVDLVGTTRTRIQQKLAALDPTQPATLTLDPAALVDAAKLKAVLAKTLAWVRKEAQRLAGQALAAIPTDLTIDLGLARLSLAADAQQLTWGAALTVDPAKFPVDLPIRFAPTTVSLTNGALALSTGLELAAIEGLPFTPAVALDLVAGKPRLAVALRKTGATPVLFPLIADALADPDRIPRLVVDLLRPLLDLGLGQLDAVLAELKVAGLSLAELLDLLGLHRPGGAWKQPDPKDIAVRLLGKLTPLVKQTATDAASTLGLAFDPATLGLSTKIPLSLGDGPVAVGIDGLSLALLDAQGKLAPTLGFSKFGLQVRGEDGAPAIDGGGLFSIGTVGASVSADVYPPALKDVALELRDVRLPLGSGGGKGEADLLPKDKQNPGFNLDLGWKPQPSGFSANFPGGAPKLVVEIDRVLGPIDVKRLTAKLTPEAGPTELALTLDAAFALGGLTITPQGLGVTIPFKEIANPGNWVPRLEGLGLGFARSGVTIAGALAKTDTGFAGQAVIKAYEFQLGALAAYDKMGDGTASLAVFGVLRMNLGGPPFFVVTGVAAGLGVNRSFERPRRTEDLRDNPLLVTMQGDKPLDLAAFRKGLAPKSGAFWLAGGVKFISYGFIHGDALLYILLDGGFELGLLAIARMEIPELLRINLAIEAGLSFRGPDPTLYAKAALYESWLLHPDCKITGGFALQVWPTRGDAVITLGGYHPAFKRPDTYPEVERLGFRWSLGTALQIKGGCYFAMTPREAMGGGRLEVEGRWGPLSAGFHAGVDGLFRWDPFHFDINIEVGIWGAVDLWFGRLRFSLGVGLHVWGPPIGGVATIDLGVTSFSIPFGEEPDDHPDLPVATFLRDHLHVALPAGTGGSAGRVEWPALPLADETDGAGRPIRLQILEGRAPTLPADVTPPANTLRVRGESVLRLDLAVPITALAANAAARPLPIEKDPVKDTIDADPTPNFFPLPPDTAPGLDRIDPLNFTLAGKLVARSTLTVNTPWHYGRVVPRLDRRQMALFGPYDGFRGASSESMTRVCAVVELDLTAQRVREQLVDKLTLELSRPGETCPLPLAADASGFLARAAAPLGALTRWSLADLQRLAPKVAARCLARGGPLPYVRQPLAGLAEVRAARILRGHTFRRRHVGLAPHAVERPPQVLGLAYLDLPRVAAPLAARTTVPDSLADLPRVAPPRPVTRSPLVAALALVAVAPRTRPTEVTAPAIAASRLALRTHDGKRPRVTIAPPGRARRGVLVIDPTAFGDRKGGTPRIAPLRVGELCVVELARADARRAAAFRLHLEGDQRLRLVALALDGAVLLDRELPPGTQDLLLPAGARRLALLGLGADVSPLVFEMRLSQPAAPTLDGAVDPLLREAAALRTAQPTDPLLLEAAPLRQPTDPRLLDAVVRPEPALRSVLRPGRRGLSPEARRVDPAATQPLADIVAPLPGRVQPAADLAPAPAPTTRAGRFVPRIPLDQARRVAPPAALPVRGFSPTTPLASLGPRILLAPGAIVELLDVDLPRRDPLGVGAATCLLGQVHRLALFPCADARDRGVLTVAVAGALAVPEALRKIRCSLGDQPRELAGVLVRGDTALVWCSCDLGGRIAVEIPHALRLLGVAHWAGVDRPPDDALDRPILHPLRPQQGAARFTLEAL